MTLSQPACLHAPPRKARANPKEPRLRQSLKQIGALHIKVERFAGATRRAAARMTAALSPTCVP